MSYFIKQGLDYVNNNPGTPPTVEVSNPQGYFNSGTLVSLGSGNTTVEMKDGVTGDTGDGLYTIVFVDNELTIFGAGVDGPAIHVVQGKCPASNDVLQGWQFSVSLGAIVGYSDLRIIG